MQKINKEKMIELILPSLGENINKGTIVSILVEVGDEVTRDQPLMEVETDKVTAEVPAELDGVIKAVLVNVGEEISENAVIFLLETNEAVDDKEIEEKEVPIDNMVPKAPLTIVEPSANGLTEKPTVPSLAVGPLTKRVQENKTNRTKGFRASPLARKFAREIGLNIQKVTSESLSGRVSIKDVKAFAKRLNQNRSNSRPSFDAPALPDFSKWGTIRKQAMSGIAQATSKNMSTAWSQIPHAWLQEKADISELESKRQQYKTQIKEKGGALTITAILVKVLAKALEAYPIFNVSLDPQSKEIIFKDFIHIGVAVDTERGLVVPKIENANQKTITDIALELGEISKKARDKKLAAADLEGATFTISNLGGIGTTSIFPIVNYPQAAIMGIAASNQEAVWMGEKFEPRLMMPMTIGFDHRIINGADAARFLKHVKELLEDSFLWSL